MQSLAFFSGEFYVNSNKEGGGAVKTRNGVRTRVGLYNFDRNFLNLKGEKAIQNL